VHTSAHLISAVRNISKVTPLRSPSSLPNGFGYSIHMHCGVPSVSASICIVKLAQWWYQSAYLFSLDCHLQVHFPLLSRTTCSRSKYHICGWIATLIHRDIHTLIHRCVDANTHWLYELHHYVKVGGADKLKLFIQQFNSQPLYLSIWVLLWLSHWQKSQSTIDCGTQTQAHMQVVESFLLTAVQYPTDSSP